MFVFKILKTNTLVGTNRKDKHKATCLAKEWPTFAENIKKAMTIIRFPESVISCVVSSDFIFKYRYKDGNL